ncbi:MAG: hypothetical protein IJJ45_07570 [Clostridia bacterium]|nr:hypothetical protein [Clostridia bacterium]
MNNNPVPNEGGKGAPDLKQRIGRIVMAVWRILSNNFGLKILSLVLAIILWNYVITSNTSITRSKTLSGLTGYVSGRATLGTNGLALLKEPSEELGDITVTVEAPQAYYARISPENVQVTLDLSNVRTAGTQEVPLRAATSYGRVTEISPDSLTLTFEAQDSRSVPINASLTGDIQADYWYNITRINPPNLSVSGAASVVRSISSAAVAVDVTGHDAPFTQAQPYTLLATGTGEEISQQMLNRSSSSVSVSVDVYPTKELPVSTDPANVITGQPAEGYVVQSVSMQPETVTVAADEELLEGLSELVIEPVNVDGLTQSFTARAAISQLSGLKNLSSEQVYANVVIVEASISGWIDEVGVQVTGKGEGLSVEYGKLRVYVTGPRSEVERLQQEGTFVSIDLSGKGAGVYEIVPRFDTERYPDMVFQPEHETMTVTLAEVGVDE